MKDHNDSRPSLVERFKAHPDELRKDQSVLEKHVRHRSVELAHDFGITDISFSTYAVDVAHVRKQVERLSAQFYINPLPVLQVALFPGLQFLAPPYDVDWHAGSGMPFSAMDGHSTVFGGNGFSASGFGIYLTCDRNVSVSVMPQGQFIGSWCNFDPPSPQRSSGGTGTAVYSDGSLVLSRESRTWSVESPGQFTGAAFDQSFASTATPALPGSFGTVPLGPVLFDMMPGKRYLVWFWVWIFNEAIEGKSFLVMANAKVPLITVNVGDPLFLH